ncbi:glycosyltransferase [Allokutzneria sp. A3M-2-11 16]|uniref:glycosyltransferase n=1 Tax=Allokutzneria sp. A3M-2-11 16 TaxID=2962043 RepID=UPI0020B8AF13|nr:glycosyltransferase [Allokutzneria sp. A3M-2-11 16]MCP3798347.1 glycosyltransferase [Allokutzneria sp. A3M-2-11 16]
MSRILFVVPPLAGHVLPTVALGQELAERGHDVAWVGHTEVACRLLPPELTLFPAERPGSETWLTETYERSRGLRGPAAFQFLWKDFLVPLAGRMIAGVEAAVHEFGADLLVVDQQALAGALIARKHRLPWITSATTSAELTNPFTMVPKFGEWVRAQLDELQRAQGIRSDDAALGDLRFSEHLVLAYTTESFVGMNATVPSQCVFVGPSLGKRVESGDYDWDWLDPRRQHVLVSMGTIDRENNGRFLNTVVEAVAPLAHRVQVSIAAAPGLIERSPDHVRVREFVPQLDLLKHSAAVVCHGGHNTVCESLANGLPLVVAPIRDDQPIIAEQVVASGVGRRVHFGRVRPAELREAILSVLDQPGYRAAAEQIQSSFADAGGTVTAADHVEKLL